MSGRPRLFPGQNAVDVKISLSEDLRDQLRRVAASVGLDASSYVRTLVCSHLNRIRVSESAS